MPQVCLVILNWNNWSDTITCLESVFASDHQSYRAVVIDNGSTDDSVERICSWAANASATDDTDARPRLVVYDRTTAEAGGDPALEAKLLDKPGLVLVSARENLGFAAGSNLGMRYGLALGAAYILLLNNDTIIAPDALTVMTSFLDLHEEFAAITGQIRYFGRPDVVWNCGGSIAWYGAPYYMYADAPAALTPQSGYRRIEFATGCALMFRARTLATAGLLTERFFHGEEDFELALRYRRAHMTMACCYSALIYHKVGTSIGAAVQRNILRTTYLHYLNRFINLRGYWPRPVWQIWRLLYCLYIVYLLRCRYAQPLQSISQLNKRLLRDSQDLQRVDRNVFEQALRLHSEN